MPIKVYIKDFQSIEELSFEVSGFTAVTGDNNLGKSAVMRAIRGVFTNPGGHAFVRHGAPHCIVRLEFDDGQVVEWRKGKGVNHYTVNGQEFLKVGRGYPGIPDEVKQLGVAPVTAGREILWPQFARQVKGQSFLIDEQGSVVAEALADVERVGRLNQALRLSEREKRTAASTLKIRRSDLEDLTQELDRYKDLDDHLEQLQKLEQLSEQYEKLMQGVGKLRGYLSVSKTRREQIKKLEPLVQVEVPAHEDLVETQQLLSRLKELQELQAKGKGELSKWSPLAALEVPEDQGLTQLINQEKEMKTLQIRLRRRKKEVKALEMPEFELPDTKRAEKAAQGLEKLQRLLQRREKALKGLKEAEEQLQGLEQELVGIRSEMEVVLGEFEECPLCGTSCLNNHAPQ